DEGAAGAGCAGGVGVVVVQAGASNAQVAEAACAAGLAGYEFASGIPGTIGGAAIMNAGAYDGEFRDVAASVRCLTPDGDIVDVSAEEVAWSYRHSMMMERGYVVLGATLRLRAGDATEIRARMDDLARRRAEKQPLEMPSAGSTFKRPEGYFAGKLIQDAGLRGYQVGGAQVSTKHTGFVVNAGGATAADVLQLIADVQARVYENEGVRLEPEVRVWE
ncbi:MAG: UDP-N-acetylmuramate dehydrogenase, partial [Eggerthellaceae bacterium]|nr:UDP-N-acetylmuramate dehydrogenase [Eggerthellaceae bacterium]